MNQIQRYTWLIDAIQRAGKITYKELSERWERNKDFSDNKPLSRATFNRWRDAIYEQFGIMIDCQRTGGYQYYIANPEEIENNRLKKWMLDSFAVGNLINENLLLKDRILVESIPSGRDHLTAILEAMKTNHALDVEYKPFYKSKPFCLKIEPYCVKLFENRWYLLGRNLEYGELRTYALDRIVSMSITESEFKMPKEFNAESYFTNAYGVVIQNDSPVERVVIRAYDNQKFYLQSLPLHHSQQCIHDSEEYADFEMYLAPTYDFIMRLLQCGTMVEALAPKSLRRAMKDWSQRICKRYE